MISNNASLCLYRTLHTSAKNDRVTGYSVVWYREDLDRQVKEAKGIKSWESKDLPECTRLGSKLRLKVFPSNLGLCLSSCSELHNSLSYSDTLEKWLLQMVTFDMSPSKRACLLMRPLLNFLLKEKLKGKKKKKMECGSCLRGWILFISLSLESSTVPCTV